MDKYFSKLKQLNDILVKNKQIINNNKTNHDVYKEILKLSDKYMSETYIEDYTIDVTKLIELR